MIVHNPKYGVPRGTNSPLLAVRLRNPDGTPNVGSPWDRLPENMGVQSRFIEYQKTWEAVYYADGDTLPE